MGWAQDRVEQIKANQQAEEARKDRAATARVVISNSADVLWESLVAELEKNTKEFADGLPLAKEKNLRTDRLNSNNLTISTTVFPLLHFEIIYHRGLHVDGLLRTTFQSLIGETKIQKLHPIRFTTDSDLQPYFTDGERYQHPKQVAEELMEKVAEFFENALKMPKYLA